MYGLEQRIRRALTPDLLKPEYRAENRTNPLFGHCYVATEALYHLILQNNGHTCGFVPAPAKQYTSKGLRPPYAAGRRAGFLTKEPGCGPRSDPLFSHLKDHTG